MFINRRTNKFSYIPTMDCYAVIRMNEIQLITKRKKKTKNKGKSHKHTLSKNIHTEWRTYCYFPYIKF